MEEGIKTLKRENNKIVEEGIKKIEEGKNKIVGEEEGNKMKRERAKWNIVRSLKKDCLPSLTILI